MATISGQRYKSATAIFFYEITLKFDPIQRTCRLEGGKVANEMMADARRRTLPNKSNWNDISIEC